MAGDFDLDTWLEDYEPYIATAKVVQKAALIAEHTRLDLAWIKARQAADDVMHDAEAADVEQALRACETEIAASEKTFTFRSAGQETWQNLKRKYPPTDAQRTEGLDTNLEPFSIDVIVACSHEPKITRPQAETMMRKLPPGEYEKLYRAVLEANGEVLGAPKSVLAAFTDRSRLNDASSTTGLRLVSPDGNSSGTLADPSPDISTTTTPDG